MKSRVRGYVSLSGPTDSTETVERRDAMTTDQCCQHFGAPTSGAGLGASDPMSRFFSQVMDNAACVYHGALFIDT